MVSSAERSPSEVVVAIDVDVPMRDGILLRANLYSPAHGVPGRGLLVRTPYGKDDLEQQTWAGFNAVALAARGYVVAIQDVRGRFRSEGEWSPYEFEATDGYDTIEWLAGRPECDGTVGMLSASYCGFAQLAAAVELPPSLAAIAPGAAWSDPMDGLFARGGCLELGLAYRWALENGYAAIARREELTPVERRDLENELSRQMVRADVDAYWRLPAHSSDLLDELGVGDLGALNAVRTGTLPRGLRPRLDTVGELPAFLWTGWYDEFQQGAIDNFHALKDQGPCRLTIGPWTHLTFGDPIGELHFGAHANRESCGPNGESLIDQYLEWSSPRPHGFSETDQPVHVFAMGVNEWRCETTWPPEDVRDVAWQLSPNDLLLSGTSTDASIADFVSDPGSPVPTVGGNGVATTHFAIGPVSQRAIEDRSDVLVFSSPPLEDDLEVCGRVTVRLTARADVVSADWVARLCNVYPDGSSINLCDGVVRAVHEPGAWREIEVDLWNTYVVFKAGHRLRVHVTGSNFPRWDRNLHTGDQGEDDYVVATQELLVGGSGLSTIVLPVRDLRR
ncbi:uncharacterized protein ACVW00_000011 [Marmoricola sp. URHA0025 HA25]